MPSYYAKTLSFYRQPQQYMQLYANIYIQLQRSHLDQLLIKTIIQLIISTAHKAHTQKVRVYNNIQGNEIVYSPTNKGSTSP